MPKKVLPDVAAFRQFSEALLQLGFRPLSRAEVVKDSERLELKAPSPREGRETGFIYTANGLTVCVWTTFLAQEGRAREKDAGWVLIKEGDEVKYFTRPMSRTKNFLRRLFWYARIARRRVLARPLCPRCRGRMDIAYGNALKARYWQCAPKPKFHKEPIFLSWDYGLPQAALKFLQDERKQRARTRARTRAKGKRPGTALLRRRGWKVGRPTNLVV